MAVTLTIPTRSAATMGVNAGKAAASWAFDGNTAHHTYVAFLAGFEAGDPMVMDYYDCGDPLSGEWADGLTVYTLATSVGIGGAGINWEANGTDGLIDAVASSFEESFRDSYYAELQRVALIHTSGE